MSDSRHETAKTIVDAVSQSLFGWPPNSLPEELTEKIVVEVEPLLSEPCCHKRIEEMEAEVTEWEAKATRLKACNLDKIDEVKKLQAKIERLESRPDEEYPYCYRAALADLASARAEIERLKTKTYCAYCGDEFPIDEDNSDVSEHIASCTKHPMRAKEIEIERLKEAVRVRGGCRVLSEGNACDCGLCKRDAEIERLKKEAEK
jgi:hypothetical protein